MEKTKIAEAFRNNRGRLAERLQPRSLGILFAGGLVRRSADDYYPFFANRNFYYATGIEQENSVFVCGLPGGEKQEWLFIDQADRRREIWTGKKLTADEACERSGIGNIMFTAQLEGFLHKLIHSGQYENIYLDLDMHGSAAALSGEQEFARKVRELYPHMRVQNIYPHFKQLRMIKSEREANALRQAVALTGEGLDAVRNICRPGTYEYQLEAEFKYTLAQKGCREPAFKPIVAAGERTFYLHYDSPGEKVEAGDLVLCDVGAAVDGYCADISRVYPAGGRFSQKQRQIYQAAYEGLLAAQSVVRPGCSFKSIDEAARAVVCEHLTALKIIKSPEELGKYMIHGSVHHIGLDVHDIGLYDCPVEKNMAFTLDVGIYVPEWGVGLRIEDDALVTGQGVENLADTAAIAKKLEDLQS